MKNQATISEAEIQKQSVTETKGPLVPRLQAVMDLRQLDPCRGTETKLTQRVGGHKVCSSMKPRGITRER